MFAALFLHSHLNRLWIDVWHDIESDTNSIKENNCAVSGQKQESQDRPIGVGVIYSVTWGVTRVIKPYSVPISATEDTQVIMEDGILHEETVL